MSTERKFCAIIHKEDGTEVFVTMGMDCVTDSQEFAEYLCKRWVSGHPSFIRGTAHEVFGKNPFVGSISEPLFEYTK